MELNLRTALETTGILAALSTIGGLLVRQGMHVRRTCEVEKRMKKIEDTCLTEARHEMLTQVSQANIYSDLGKCQAELKAEIAALRIDNSNLGEGFEDLKGEVRLIRDGMSDINKSLVKLTTTLELQKVTA